MAVVVMINNVGPLDPQEVVTDLAGEVLRWTPPPPKRFAGDPAPLIGTYAGPGRGPGDMMEIEVTETPEGPGFSIDGSPPRVIPWIEGLTFGRGLPRLIFRRADGEVGPVTELRFSMPGAHMILEKQPGTPQGG